MIIVMSLIYIHLARIGHHHRNYTSTRYYNYIKLRQSARIKVASATWK